MNETELDLYYDQIDQVHENSIYSEWEREMELSQQIWEQYLQEVCNEMESSFKS